ncbi:VOC family protein [Isoptericola sp. BMS4]|uniref:VOC family protein n=1 Tax=Isoptericola sp. BMS4 TaxID=2527875 RepID=UPI00141DA7A4|nr:VOC family protein [Isoptericola sp. BMS4]
MTDTFPAFSLGPVPQPVPGAPAPELFRGIYGMPMFVTVPSADVAASSDFWVRGLGFFELFAVPGVSPSPMVHLRRWAFQDVLLVAGEPAAQAPAQTVSFSCVLDQVDEIAAACEQVLAGSTTGPRTTPWNTVDLEVVTPEGTRVVMTAARPWDPDSAEAAALREIGIDRP